jgi:hypothetical protein
VGCVNEPGLRLESHLGLPSVQRRVGCEEEILGPLERCSRIATVTTLRATKVDECAAKVDPHP